MSNSTTDGSREGTGAHFAEFLDWAEREGQLPRTMVQNWRNASLKVLELEDDWPNLNLVRFDLSSLLSQFEVLKRERYTSGSMAAYKGRTRAAIEAYRRWLVNPNIEDWKPTGSSRNGTGTKASHADASSAQDTSHRMADFDSGYVPARVSMVEYPLPLREGVQGRLWLPEDLTHAEAKRVGRFAESVALDQPSETT